MPSEPKATTHPARVDGSGTINAATSDWLSAVSKICTFCRRPFTKPIPSPVWPIVKGARIAGNAVLLVPVPSDVAFW